MATKAKRKSRTIEVRSEGGEHTMPNPTLCEQYVVDNPLSNARRGQITQPLAGRLLTEREES